MDLIRDLPVFVPEDILPHCTGFSQYSRYQLGLVASTCIDRLTESGLGLIKFTNLPLHETIDQCNRKYDIIFNIRDGQGNRPYSVKLSTGEIIDTPNYINCMSVFPLYLHLDQDLIVDAYMCPTELRYKLFKCKQFF